MKRHPSFDKIAALAAETAPPRLRGRLEEHVRFCKRCADEYARMVSLLEPRYAGRIIPPSSLRDRVLSSARAYSSGIIEAGRRSRPSSQRFGKRSIAAAAAIVITIGTGILIWRMSIPSPPSLIITALYGKARIDTAVATPGKAAGAGSHIVIDAGSLAELSYGTDYVVRLAGGTEATIETLRFNGRTKRIQIVYRLHGGAFYSRAGKSANVSYKIETPLAAFRSYGTEFLIVSSDDRVALIMADGRLSATAHASGKTVSAPGGKKIIIGKDVLISDAGENDLALADRIAAAETGINILADDLDNSGRTGSVKAKRTPDDFSGDAARNGDEVDTPDTLQHDRNRSKIMEESRDARHEMQRVRRGGRRR